MATGAREFAEKLLARAASDRQEPPMVIESFAASDFFPKWGEDIATEEEWNEIWDQHRQIFEQAVAEREVAWGEPAYCGPSMEAAGPWGPLGDEVACWDRGEFTVCVYLGQEDAELPIAVDVAVIRRDAY